MFWKKRAKFKKKKEKNSGAKKDKKSVCLKESRDQKKNVMNS